MEGVTEEGPVAAAMRGLRAALDAGDLGLLEQLFVEDVRWFGSRGGACWDRDDVVAMLGPIFAGPVRPRVTGLRAIGNGFVVRAELPSGSPDETATPWAATALVDDAGRIAAVQEYEDARLAERDLEAVANQGRASVEPSGAAAVSGLVPLLQVADVSRAVTFYQALGLSLRRSHEVGGETVWAFLDSGTAAVMVAFSEEPPDPRALGVEVFLYTRDLAGLRQHLLAGGARPTEILDGSPGPRRQMRLVDPDGHPLTISQIDGVSAGGQYSAGLHAGVAVPGQPSP